MKRGRCATMTHDYKRHGTTTLLPSAQARQVIDELDELRVVDRLEHFGHRRIVAAARAALVFPQRLQKIVFALVGEPGHVNLPRKIGPMADIAVILLDQRPTAYKARR